MNKQEALEAILSACREMEGPSGDKKVHYSEARNSLAGHVALAVGARFGKDQAESLVRAGGALLYLLTDEEGEL